MKKLIATVLVTLLLLCCAAGAENEAVGLANPWVETSEEELTAALGFAFAVPEGAENVTFRMLEAQQLGEMTFTLNGMDYVARIKPAEEFEDISGLYYEWGDPIEDTAVEGRQTWEARAVDGERTVDLVLWYDAVPGLMYSLSTSAENDLDGFDIIGVALQVYAPMQGEA